MERYVVAYSGKNKGLPLVFVVAGLDLSLVATAIFFVALPSIC